MWFYRTCDNRRQVLQLFYIRAKGSFMVGQIQILKKYSNVC